MQIVEVLSKRHIKQFHQLPYKIYADNKNWIPHLKQDIENVFEVKKNKAFRNGIAKRWLLKDSNEIIGRVAAFMDKREKNKSIGGMGFFECINDKKAAFLLFDTCKKYLEENGAELMEGPINFGEKLQFWGLLVENFKDINAYGMNYNKSYYQSLFEEYGFQKYYEQWVYKRDMHQRPQEIFYRKYNQIKDDPNIKITSGRGKNLKEIAHNIRIVYNDAWQSHKGFKPLSVAAAENMVESMKSAIDKDIFVFVYDKNEPIAFWVNLPEVNQIFKYVNGNLNWWGKLKFLYYKWKGVTTIMSGLVFGVSQAYQGQGFESAMIVWSYENIVSLGRYHTITLSWIGDFNPKMLKVCENLGAKKYRTLYTYRYLFDRNKEFKRRPIIK